jgi:hypothetical protein
MHFTSDILAALFPFNEINIRNFIISVKKQKQKW